jgi:hypothetical protein
MVEVITAAVPFFLNMDNLKSCRIVNQIAEKNCYEKYEFIIFFVVHKGYTASL